MTCRSVQERFEPAEAIARIHCPFLAIFRERDTLEPARESAMIYGRELRMAGNRDAAIVVFLLANHRILVEETGEFVTGYLDLLADWAVRHVSR